MRRSIRKTLPKKDEAWAVLAERWQGEIRRNRRGISSVRIENRWVIVLDQYTQSDGHSSQTCTRWRSVYRATDDFRFRIYRRTWLSDIGKLFGMQDIVVGQPAIDADWIIKSNSEGRIQSLLGLPEIVDAMRAVRSASLQAKPLRGRQRAPGRNVLELTVEGILRDIDRLDGACRLMNGTLERMAKLGSAQPDAEVDLR